jgi:hypothetical protein
MFRLNATLTFITHIFMVRSFLLIADYCFQTLPNDFQCDDHYYTKPTIVNVGNYSNYSKLLVSGRLHLD